MQRAVLGLICAATLYGADYQVGVASLVITPGEPIYLSGYGSRKHASEGVLQDLKAKALAIRDRSGATLVIVTTDLIGLPRSISDPLAAKIQKAYGLDRSHLLLNSSHTHTGPLIGGNLQILFDLSTGENAAVQRYAQKLSEDLLTVVGSALQNLKPANLWFGRSEAHFGINRREPTASGIQIGVNPKGPTDPDVPVLKVTSPDGKTRAILFGYACHNTTLTGEFYKISGDYAGYAQTEVEKANPGATAMFMELCGADQNPNPRSTLELATQHGAELGAAVAKAAAGQMTRVHGPVRASLRMVDLEFAHHTREKFESRLRENNPWRVRNAKAMLKTYDEGSPIRRYSYPVQAVALGKEVVVLALGGEVVVDYALRTKKEFGTRGLVVAGYSNDVMAYIPSQRVLKEGGYEADESMIYYGQPGPWADNVEERIFGAIREVMKRVGRKGA